MPKSCFKSIGQFMACDKFFAFVNEICDLIGFGMNYNLS